MPDIVPNKEKAFSANDFENIPGGYHLCVDSAKEGYPIAYMSDGFACELAKCM